jgi:ABC-2 type transport system ATP-binding protein
MMNPDAIRVTSVRKSFDTLTAVDDISLEVKQGEIFGLLGPNGAGKTTLIRMIMDIIRPDSGMVEIFGHRLTDKDKERIGYLPEERGLYVRQKVQSLLEYLARLKGLDRPTARRQVLSWLERLDMTSVKDKKVRELSKGNQQKIQLIAALAADPTILILDEPFSGLDPINTRVVSSLIKELSASGKTVMLSTHQMGLVESMCRRVLMVNHGRRIFYGDLEKIKRQYSDDTVIVKSNADFGRCDLVARYLPENGAVKVYLRVGVQPQELLSWLLATGNGVDLFQVEAMTLDDIYVKAVQDSSREIKQEPIALGKTS